MQRVVAEAVTSRDEREHWEGHDIEPEKAPQDAVPPVPLLRGQGAATRQRIPNGAPQAHRRFGPGGRHGPFLSAESEPGLTCGSAAHRLALAATLLAGCGATAAVEDPGGGSWPQLHPPGQRARAVVWAVGDGADGGAAARKVVRRIRSGRPDWFLYLGDVYEGTSLSRYWRKYGRVSSRLAKITA